MLLPEGSGTLPCAVRPHMLVRGNTPMILQPAAGEFPWSEVHISHENAVSVLLVSLLPQVHTHTHTHTHPFIFPLILVIFLLLN
jgi:hypothetical protein